MLSKRVLHIVSIVCVSALLIAISQRAFAEKPLSVVDCIGLAYQYYPTLKSKEANIAAAQGRVTTARAGFLPKFTATAMLRHYMHRPGINTPSPIAPHPAVHEYTEQTVPRTTIQMDQTLFDFGRTIYGYKDAKIGESVTISNVELFQQDLSVLVVEVFFGVLLAEKNVGVARSSKKSLDEYFREVRNMYDEGSVTKNDLLIADVSREQAGLQVERTENDLDIARLNFRNVVGIEAANLDSNEFASSKIPPSPKELMEEAFGQRIEMAINEKQQAQAVAQRKLATSQYLPNLYATAEARYVKDDIQIHQDQYTFTVGMKWPVFDGMAAIGKRRSAAASQLSLAFERDALENQITVEVEKAYDNLKLAKRSIEVERKSKAQATENLRLQRQLYLNGASTSYDVLKAESIWTNAQYAYYRSLYDFNIGRAKLLRAVGASIEDGWKNKTSEW